MCLSDFSKQKTAKERWQSLVSSMGDREEYLETPLPLPPSLYGRSLARSLARSYADVITKFSRLDGYTNFSYPWCFADALSALKLRYNMRPFLIYSNSNVAPRLGGIKQKKLIIHPSTSLLFVLFYSPKPRSQVRILIALSFAPGACCRSVLREQAPSCVSALNHEYRFFKRCFSTTVFRQCL